MPTTSIASIVTSSILPTSHVDVEETFLTTGRPAVNVADDFPEAGALVSAPIALSVFCQLMFVAAAADFKLTKPEVGFKYVRYPDSFRTTVIQLVNTGCRALSNSYANFDEIRRHSGTVHPTASNIVQLLAGSRDDTPYQNYRAIERHLPNQVRMLSSTIEACLEKARDTEKVFGELLEFTMELHEACAMSKGDKEEQILDDILELSCLEEDKKAKEEEKERLNESMLLEQNILNDAQSELSAAVVSMPTVRSMFWMNIGDMVTRSPLRFFLPVGYGRVGLIPGLTNGARHYIDPGYRYADILRLLAEALSSILTPDSQNEGRHGDMIRTLNRGGCHSIATALERQVLDPLERFPTPSPQCGGEGTIAAVQFAKTGIGYAEKVEDLFTSGNPEDLQQLHTAVVSWRDSVLEFANNATHVLRLLGISAVKLVLDDAPATPVGTAELSSWDSRFRIRAAAKQLNSSRNRSAAASDNLRTVTDRISDLVRDIASKDTRKRGREGVVRELRQVIVSLCELKGHLNTLVKFFTSLNKLVSITMRDQTNRLVRAVESEFTPQDDIPGRSMQSPSLGSWARKSIYDQAISTAKIGLVVENISAMYITLYNRHIHPGVNMVLEMGHIDNSDDKSSIEAAAEDVKKWASTASDHIERLVNERMQAHERNIQKRMQELDISLKSRSRSPPSSVVVSPRLPGHHSRCNE